MERRPKYLWCVHCKASIGVHPNGKPVGYVADKATREERRKTHADIDCYMLIVGIYSMNNMYKRIAKFMGMPRGKAHIGMFDIDQCRTLRRILSEDLVHRITIAHSGT